MLELAGMVIQGDDVSVDNFTFSLALARTPPGSYRWKRQAPFGTYPLTVYVR